MKRPPIVVIMGHVDHGKTTLLDHIRKTNVVAREAGGITQSIGAYEITHNERLITFVDTPGHEAFSKMRAYGASVADLAVLVVAADDGVKPQTLDALSAITKTKTPFVVAINKIDKPEANIEKTKNDLAQAEVYLEGYGGSVSWHTVSAKTGEGVSDLLDLILLATDMENLECDPDAGGEGVIITSTCDPRQGNCAGVIIKNGTVRRGDYIRAGRTSGKIKTLANFLGQSVAALAPSAPALIVGFDTVPKVGEPFATSAGKIAAAATPAAASQTAAKGRIKNAAKLILKADEAGSLEALAGIVKKTTAESMPFVVIEESVGNITENDAKTAAVGNAIIVAFRSKIDKSAENFIRARNVRLIHSSIIYEIEESLRDLVLADPMKPTGILEVLATFGERKGRNQLVGGKVAEGAVKNKTAFEIWAGENKIGLGTIVNLQSGKENVAEAKTGKEVGLMVESDAAIEKGHQLRFLKK